jgi:hypothetical protein
MTEHERTTAQSEIRPPDDDAPLVVRNRRKTVRVTAWILVGLAIYGLRYEFLIFDSLICGAYLLAATMAMILMLGQGRITWRGAAVMAVAIAGLFFYGSPLARFVRFHVLKSGYVSIANDVRKGLADDERAELRRSGIQLDDGEGGPVRIAFPWICIVDNWCGVIFDPTDELADFCGDAGQDHRGFLRDSSLRKLFGGDMTRCERLEKGWYFCWFT